MGTVNDAARMAVQAWSRGSTPSETHPVIVQYQLYGFSLKELHRIVLVPLRTITGEIRNLLSVRSTGDMRTLESSKVDGLFWFNGSEFPDSGNLYICEDFRAAATIRNLMGWDAVAAVTADNVPQVVRAIRAHYPGLNLIVLAGQRVAPSTGRAI